MKEHSMSNTVEPGSIHHSFSIIIPVYNAQSTLPRTVESMRTQNYDAFEVLFSDDGSTDGTKDFCRALAGKDPRFRLLENNHLGRPGAMRNFGIRAAKNEYVFFCDADDEILPGALVLLNNALNRFHAPDVLGGACESGVIRESGFQLDNVLFNSSKANLPTDGISFLEGLGRNLICTSCIAICRREFLLRNNLFYTLDFTLREDHDWMPRVYFRAKTVAAEPVPYTRYNRHDGSITTHLTGNSLLDLAKCTLSLCRFFETHLSEMSLPLKQFWASHAADSVIWFFFNPLYTASFSRPERNRALKLLNDPSVERIIPFLSRPKRVGMTLILHFRILAAPFFRLYFHLLKKRF